MPGKVILIDGNSLLYRAFFALPPLTTSRGEATNAVYGFLVMLNKILEEEKPDYIAAAFDLPGPTFRHREFADYKATRERAPDDLRSQIPLAHELLESLKIPVFQLEGYEADDLLGTLARQAETEGDEVLIISGDLDTLQLVSEKTRAVITRRGITDTVRYDAAAIHERFGISPSQLTDYKSLRGDTTDNIPGVPGIGEKTAVALLQQFGSLENLLENVSQVKPARVAAALQTFTDQAILSKRLATILCDLPVEADWEKLKLEAPDEPRLKELYQRLEFRGLLKKLSSAETEHEPVGIIQSKSEAEAAAKELKGAELSLSVLAEEGSCQEAKALGFLLGASGKETIYFPAELLASFQPLLEDKKTPKLTHGAKTLFVHLHRLGIELAGLNFDTEIASHLADSLRKSHDLWEIAFDLLGAPVPEPLEKGAPIPVRAQREALKIKQMQALKPRLEASLKEQDLERLFYDLEMPLISILAEMETAGVSLDLEHLKIFSAHLEKEIAAGATQIFFLAGEEFVINSPKQLQRILFEKLHLPARRRTKTGFSTDAAALAHLADKYEIVARLLEYRELTKLKSTYVDALPTLVNPHTGRIHTTFNQTVTATGRLSSSDPNLQNIPIRTELGKEIRRAFIARRAGDLLLAADYSQIELRVLAHIAEDEALCAIFARDENLHTATACEIFEVSPEQVTSEMRRLAKIVNFSIPYGTSAASLAQRIKVTTEEARQYMRRYFERFAGVARYMSAIVEEAREKGYVTTLLGRRRRLPEISSSNSPRRELAERMAINTPIQGSAADIMKLAMLKAAEALRQQHLTTKLILQVHDELVFEGPREELHPVAALAKATMESAYQLQVPLKVEIEFGNNWRDLELLALEKK